MANDTIVKINPSDIISESMNKINTNFEVLGGKMSYEEDRWKRYSEYVSGLIDDLKNNYDIQSSEILKNIDKLDNKIVSFENDNEDITSKIADVLNSASGELGDFISRAAGQYVSESMKDYVKTTNLNNLLSEGYVTSAAFSQYISDVYKSNLASVNTTVANSTFYFEDGFLVFKENKQKSTFRSIVEYYDSLSVSDKNAIDPNGKGFGDTTVLSNLVARCEQVFVTIAKELSSITQTVIDGVSSTSIVNMIRGTEGENDGDIVAAIFLEANENGSSISLNADKINIDANHSLNIKSGGKLSLTGDQIEITSGNLTVNPSTGKVAVKGAIEATSLKIAGGIDISDESKLEQFVKSHQNNGGDVAEYDDSWLGRALDKSTTITGGLVLTGNLLASDSNSKVTAGIIGDNTSSSEDVKFFAGTDVVEPINNVTATAFTEAVNSAPFRVLENGKLIATNAEIGGQITATSGSIGGLVINNDGSLSNGTNFSLSAGGKLVAKDVELSGNVSFSFKSLSECSTLIAVGNIYYGCDKQDLQGGSYLRFINPEKSSSTIRIDGSYRYVGDYSGCSGYRTQYIVLPNDLPEGSTINIYGDGSNYKNVFQPLYIGANQIYYGTNSESYYGSSLLSCDNYLYTDLTSSTHSWLKFDDTFFLRLLHMGSGIYYLLQVLGEYSIEDHEPPIGDPSNSYYFDSTGVGTF